MSKRVNVAKALDFIDEWADTTFAPQVRDDAKDMHTYCMMLKYDVYELIRHVAAKFGCELEDVFSYAIGKLATTGKESLVDAGYDEVTTIGVYGEPGKLGYRFYRPFEYRI